MGPPTDHDLDVRPHGVIRVLTLGHSVVKIGNWGQMRRGGVVDSLLYHLTFFLQSHTRS